MTLWASSKAHSCRAVIPTSSGHRRSDTVPSSLNCGAWVEARAPADDRDWKPVRLEPGTLLRHEQSDWTMRGCAGCEDIFVWEWFAVLDGQRAGRCVEFETINPGYDDTAIPPQVQPAGPTRGGSALPPWRRSGCGGWGPGAHTP